jgi:predicted nucleic acid-binding protein
VSLLYVDTSVLGRVLFDEPETSAIRRELRAFDRRTASRLLRIELRRIGLREDMQAHTDGLLAGIVLIPMSNQILTDAETLNPSTVATLDAIHLATAVSLSKARELNALMTYDKQLAAGAREHGITVLSPS